MLAHRQDAPVFGCGLQVSGDGGATWTPANPVPQLPEGAEHCYAPEVAFDRRGVLYYLFIGLQGAGNNPVGVYLSTSTNRGRSFGAPRPVLGPGNYQVRMALDRDQGRAGRIHLVWLRSTSDAPLGGLPAEANPLLSAYSDDGGATFSPPVTVSDASRARVVAPAIALGPNHAVHILYYDLQDDARDYQGLEGPPWDGTWSIVSTMSYDGGVHFERSSPVDEELIPPGRVMLIYTMASPSLVTDAQGRLYTAWWDARRGDADVFLSRSTDRGRTWSSPARVNDDPSGNGRDQYLPRLGVSPDGRLDIAYLDRRDDPENMRNDLSYSFSSDQGRSFAPRVKLSTQPSDSRIGQRYLVPSAAGLAELGGRLGLLSTSGGAVVAWPDTRNSSFGTSTQDVFTSAVRFPPDSSSSAVPVVEGMGGTVVVLAGAAAVIRARHRRGAAEPAA